MSTLKATNLSHASAASPNIVLDSAGKVTFGGAVAGAGLDLITPTSVAGTGVTLSGGAVSFSGSTSVSVNNCFTATYDNYFVIDTHTNSTTAENQIRLRAAGTDSSANYNVRLALMQSVYGTATSTTLFRLGDGGSELGVYQTTFTRSFLAEPTSLYSCGNDGGATSLYASGGIHTASTSYDGFSLIASTGTITGTLRVYGLRNS
jgi:hypothetical protein